MYSYDEFFCLGEVRGDVCLSKIEVAVKGLDGFLGLISMGLKEEEEALFVKVFPIVLDFVFGDVLMELVNLFSFILIVLDVSVIKESGALLSFFSLLLFLWFRVEVLVGKKK